MSCPVYDRKCLHFGGFKCANQCEGFRIVKSSGVHTVKAGGCILEVFFHKNFAA